MRQVGEMMGREIGDCQEVKSEKGKMSGYHEEISVYGGRVGDVHRHTERKGHRRWPLSSQNLMKKNEELQLPAGPAADHTHVLT